MIKRVIHLVLLDGQHAYILILQTLEVAPPIKLRREVAFEEIHVTH